MQNLAYGDMYLNDKYVRKRFEYYKELLQPYLKKGLKVLDIGCYTADLLNVLPKDIDYYGVDGDKAALEIAKSRGAKVYEVDLEAQEIPLLDEKFDVVIATEVLEHLKDPQRLIKQILTLTKEGGIVLLSLPNECTIFHRIKVIFGLGIDGTGFEPHYHLHFPTLKQNDDFIEKYFCILKKKYWIHAGLGGTFGILVSKIPDGFWLALAAISPSLFARGVIYLCQNRGRQNA